MKILIFDTLEFVKQIRDSIIQDTSTSLTYNRPHRITDHVSFTDHFILLTVDDDNES